LVKLLAGGGTCASNHDGNGTAWGLQQLQPGTSGSWLEALAKNTSIISVAALLFLMMTVLAVVCMGPQEKWLDSNRLVQLLSG